MRQLPLVAIDSPSAKRYYALCSVNQLKYRPGSLTGKKPAAARKTYRKGASSADPKKTDSRSSGRNKKKHV